MYEKSEQIKTKSLVQGSNDAQCKGVVMTLCKCGQSKDEWIQGE